MCTKIHHYNYLSVNNTIRSLIAEEMYYGLLFSRAKQCKTILDELTTYLLPAEENEYRNTEIQKNPVM